MGLQSTEYKIFTCPMESCPSGNQAYEIEHYNFYDGVTTSISWGMFQSANHCKMIYKVPPDINGKLVLDFKSADGKKVDLYMFPQRQFDDSDSFIIENDLLYTVEEGVYFVPTDWQFYI